MGINAEILNTPATWHVVSTQPAQNQRAMRHLSKRGFGVYRPAIMREPMLPGYLLVWTWDLEQHYRKIVSAPGVMEMLGSDGAPATLADEVVARIQLQEEKGNVTAAMRGKRRRKRWRRKRETSTDVPTEMTAKSYSA